MKKNVLIALIVIILLVLGIIIFRNVSVPPTNDQEALNQLLANQNNNPQTNPQPSNQATDQNQQQSEPQQMQTNQPNQQTNMGLQIKTTQEGSGAAVKAGDTVEVTYTGKLTDGTVFDATDKHGGQPFSFTVGEGQVIPGWDQGLIGMKVGEKRTLTIPGNLGYGAQGMPGVIPPNATLIFDIQLVSIK
jgi:peptidylprolyl isomerase